MTETQPQEMSTCPWTGEAFPAKPGKTFANDRARLDAHTAARLYTVGLINDGLLNWGTLRRWHQRRQGIPEPPYTAQDAAEDGQLSLTIAHLPA